MTNPLDTWVLLNATVATLDEDGCVQLLAQEKNGKRRRMFLLRIHSRLNKVRADRERAELNALARADR